MSKIIESGCGNVTILPGDEISNQILVSDIARKKIEELLSSEEQGYFLRVAVGGGGCAGFKYMFGFDNELDDDDIINTWDGGSVVVDNSSIQFMKGATVDFVSDFNGEFFMVKNELASSSCGCGSSFSYDEDQL